MIVICLEGCHGSGKTELCNQFAKNGFEVLDEAFMDMPEVSIAPQSLTMESSWVSFWFQRLLKRQAELEKEQRDLKLPNCPEKIFIADRSPYSAVFYAGKMGHLLQPMIRAQIKELEEQANIRIICINVTASENVLWGRICKRLEVEPWRKKYKEDSYEWMLTTLKFYNSCTWDYTVQNQENTILELMHNVIARLAIGVPKFQETCPTQIQHHLKENMMPDIPLTTGGRISGLPYDVRIALEQLSL